MSRHSRGRRGPHRRHHARQAPTPPRPHGQAARPAEAHRGRPPAGPLVEGLLQLKGRVGFVLSESRELTDVLVEGPSLRLAMDGDRVRARVTSSRQAPRRAGEIVEVLERARQQVVGAFGRLHGEAVLVMEESNVPVRLIDLRGQRPGDGELVVARITAWPTRHAPAAGVLTEILGPRGAPGVERRGLIRKYDLPESFPVDVEEEADAFGAEVPEAAWRGRETWFDRRVFTIDGADAKDFDDAVAIERRPRGGWILGVHIADVSHYVRENRPLDLEARRRGTSVYLSGTVLPMLPFALSDGLCSLRPGQARLTLACVMEIGEDGGVLSYRIFESAIRSARRFTYEQVEAVLRGEPLPGLSEDLRADVREMGRLAGRLRARRFARGSLDFDFPEAHVLTDPQGRPLDIRRRERLESHRLIEDFMLLANETVARHMRRVPFLYRIHEAPDEEKMGRLHRTLEAAGVPVPRGLDGAHPAALQQVLKAVAGKPIGPMVQMAVLRSLKQAVYSPVNAGHYGLASGGYTHFTSPIRRYPDLLVHRLVKEQLRGQLNQSRQVHYKAFLPALTAHCSRRERVAVDAEREYLDVQRVRLMEPHVGESFDGLVSGVTPFGVFVQLKDFFVEGLVHVSHLRDDYYVYDEVRMTLRGRRTGRLFEMGQPVRVLLAAANPVKRQLDFQLLEEAKRPPHPPARHRHRRR